MVIYAQLELVFMLQRTMDLQITGYQPPARKRSLSKDRHEASQRSACKMKPSISHNLLLKKQMKNPFPPTPVKPHDVLPPLTSNSITQLLNTVEDSENNSGLTNIGNGSTPSVGHSSGLTNTGNGSTPSVGHSSNNDISDYYDHKLIDVPPPPVTCSIEDIPLASVISNDHEVGPTLHNDDLSDQLSCFKITFVLNRASIRESSAVVIQRWFRKLLQRKASTIVHLNHCFMTSAIVIQLWIRHKYTLLQKKHARTCRAALQDEGEAVEEPQMQTSSTIQEQPQISHSAKSILATLQAQDEEPFLPISSDNIPYSSVTHNSHRHDLDDDSALISTQLQQIFSSLDNLDSSNQKILPSTNIDSVPIEDDVAPPTIVEPSMHSTEDLEAVSNDITTTVLTQRIELQNKTKTIEMLQKALNQQRELTVYHAKEIEKDSKKQLKLQKEEYEATIQRYQCLIDQLIDDKQSLSDKCEKLLKESCELKKKFQTKISTLEQTYVLETKKLKKTTLAAEKLKRQKWQAEEAQKIKETTIKHLEPELQRVIAKGKAEVERLKAIYEAELLQSDERAGRKFVSQLNDIRSQLEMERERACEQVKQEEKLRYMKLEEDKEKCIQQLRTNLWNEVESEKMRVKVEMSNVKEAAAKEIETLREKHLLDLHRLREEHQFNLEKTQKDYMRQLKYMEDHVVDERQDWEKEFMHQQETNTRKKVNELKNHFRRQRDKDIKAVVEKFEAESLATIEAKEKKFQSNLKRLQADYEIELKDYEITLKEVTESEKAVAAKSDMMKNQLYQCKESIFKLRNKLSTKEEEIVALKKMLNKLTQEREKVSDVIRMEYSDRFSKLEQENMELKLQIESLKLSHHRELINKERDVEKQFDKVHQRVKDSLAKKDEHYKTLLSQYEVTSKRASHLEMLLEKQSKELLS